MLSSQSLLLGIVSTGVLVSTGLPQIATPAANPISNLPFVGVMYGESCICVYKHRKTLAV